MLDARRRGGARKRPCHGGAMVADRYPRGPRLPPFAALVAGRLYWPAVQPRTHLAIDRRLCGEPLDPVGTAAGTARVGLTTVPEMAVDAAGLVHGGFVFGLADHAAMLAVNHPNVVLGSAAVRFLRPVGVGEQLIAEATVAETAGRRSRVMVAVRRVEAGGAAGACGAGAAAGETTGE